VARGGELAHVQADLRNDCVPGALRGGRPVPVGAVYLASPLRSSSPSKYEASWPGRRIPLPFADPVRNRRCELRLTPASRQR
jgi:hypothetical protein